MIDTSEKGLRELEALCNAATPGPFHVGRLGGSSWYAILSATPTFINQQRWGAAQLEPNAEGYIVCECIRTKALAELLAAAREALPFILKELKEQRARVRELEAALTISHRAVCHLYAHGGHCAEDGCGCETSKIIAPALWNDTPTGKTAVACIEKLEQERDDFARRCMIHMRLNLYTDGKGGYSLPEPESILAAVQRELRDSSASASGGAKEEPKP